MSKKLITITTLFLVITGFVGYILANNRAGSLTVNEQPSEVTPDNNQDKSIGDTKNIATSTSVKKNNPVVNEDNNELSIILFYGDGCPHCALVEKFIAENAIETKLSFESREVYYNTQNADLLRLKAKACGITTSIGVPFLWDGSKCILGDADIIEFFKTKTNLQ